MMVFHVPEKAVKLKSVGMYAEHTSESIHPVVNRQIRRYANVQNKGSQLHLICRDQWLHSNPSVSDYRELKVKQPRKKAEQIVKIK